MKRTKIKALGLVALDLLCTVIWGGYAIMGYMARDAFQMFILRLFCAVIWLIAAVLNFIRYKKENIQKN